MTNLQLASEALYFGLNIGLGSSEIVKMRRDLVQLRDIIEHVIRNEVDKSMISGSTREGYRLESTDFDLMQWPLDHKLISILSQAELYESTNNTLILMESEHCPPGFVLLRLLNNTNRYKVYLACIEENNALYVSSSKYRELMLHHHGNPQDESNGPCASRTCDVTNQKYDHAYCFVSDVWPTQALSWIERCENKTWPSIATLGKILSSGCHAVAIGHKLSSYEDVEWRISFSSAEHILVFSMNHCQFLCYGLLKLFLEEVINKKTTQDKVLCSYHLKTTLFWIVQENIVQNWCPRNLIKCFWVCFQTVINYVYHGVCPNFFIPQNNMFLGKVEGTVQCDLLQQLMGLYGRGPSCLLESRSINILFRGAFECSLSRNSLEYRVLHAFWSGTSLPLSESPTFIKLCPHNSFLRFSFDNNDAISVTFDIEYFREIDMGFSSATYSRYPVKSLQALEMLVACNHDLSMYQKTCLHIFASECFQSNAFKLVDCLSTLSCKTKYVLYKTSLKMLTLSNKFGYLYTPLYTALFHLKMHNYATALRLLDHLKVKMSQEALVYHTNVNTLAYEMAVDRLPLPLRMKRHVIREMYFDSSISFIDELKLEQEISKKNHKEALVIPPFVMLHFLSFLCLRRVDLNKAQTALQDLHVLLHFDQGIYVNDVFADISWQILGICQQIMGQIEDALLSFHKVFEQPQRHKIREAAETRIRRIYSGHLTTI